LNKKILYTVVFICLVGLLLLVLFQQKEKKFDNRVTLEKRYKNPYGLYVAYNTLPLLFNNGVMKVNSESPVEWYDSDSCSDGKNVFFLISRQFNPTTEELRKLFMFAKQGNQVFICTPSINESAKAYFDLGEEAVYDYNLDIGYRRDSGNAVLMNPPFKPDTTFFNPGYHYVSYFKSQDSVLDRTHYNVLGNDESGYPNLVKINAGKGCFYFHSNPFLFDNYFLLYKNNLDYFQKVVSLIPADKNKIIWDEYFLYKPDNGNNNTRNAKGPSPLRVMLSYPAFMWAFLLLFILLLLYIATNAKRMQRLINVVVKPKNDTLDFAKTIGRLYFEKSDHTNLAKKNGYLPARAYTQQVLYKHCAA